jgi:hypothetical protein
MNDGPCFGKMIFMPEMLCLRVAGDPAQADPQKAKAPRAWHRESMILVSTPAFCTETSVMKKPISAVSWSGYP